MVQDATEFITKDVYDNENTSVAGTGHTWIHSHDMNELRSACDIYKHFSESSIPMQGNKDKNDIKPILNEYFKYIKFSTLDNQPGYMAFVPSGGLPVSSIADFVGTATNRYPTITMAAPAAAGIEECVIQWLAELVGLKNKENGLNINAGGLLTSGGSMATLQAVHAAREQYIKNSSDGNGKDIIKLVIYASEQGHYCVEQAARMCGIPTENIRYIPSDRNTCKMKYQLIESMIEKDISNGLKPMMICASAGTVYSGAVDDLQSISKIAKKYNTWFHVDGAWGGLFAMTNCGKKILSGIENADSILIDPHKTLFIPYGVGCLLVKDKKVLNEANSFTGACMHETMPSGDINGDYDQEIPDDSMNYGFELTRNFRGFNIWVPFKLYGVEYFINELENKLELTKYCFKELKTCVPLVEMKHEPPLCVFAFRIGLQKLADMDHMNKDIFKENIENGILDGAMLDNINKLFLDNINKRGRVLLSPFRSIDNIKGDFYLRIAILSFRTQLQHVNYAIEDINHACQETIDFVANKLKNKQYDELINLYIDSGGGVCG